MFPTLVFFEVKGTNCLVFRFSLSKNKFGILDIFVGREDLCGDQSIPHNWCWDTRHSSKAYLASLVGHFTITIIKDLESSSLHKDW